MSTAFHHPRTSAAEYCGSPLPRALRELAQLCDFDTFCAAYAHAMCARIRLISWHHEVDHPPIAQRVDTIGYHATIAVGDNVWSMREDAPGALAAATAMLHSLGETIEISTLHQQRTTDGNVLVLVLAHRAGRSAWGLGTDSLAEIAGVSALISVANAL